jgi:hypothetical protein
MLQQLLQDAISSNSSSGDAAAAAVDDPTLVYVAQRAILLFNSRSFEQEQWEDALVPYLQPFLTPQGAASVASTCLERCVRVRHVTLPS